MDELRVRLAAYLAEHRVGVLGATGSAGAWARPVRYRARGLEVECLLPRWADLAYHLEQDPGALLVIPEQDAGGACWLHYQGTASRVTAPEWKSWLAGETGAAAPDDLYVLIRLTPERIDLMDERRGWGARETLELSASRNSAHSA